MRDHFLQIEIDNEEVQVDIDEFPVAINFTLEDNNDFRKKKGSESIDLTVPITNQNSKLANTIQALCAADMTGDDQMESPRSVIVRSQGHELITGKALLKRATHNTAPDKATWNIYGDNSDWAIDLNDKTLQPFLNPRIFIFNFQTVYNSWNFDGTNEAFDFVFAPVRYATPFGEGSMEHQRTDKVVTIYDLKPAISVYWLLWRAFNSLGYTLKSDFFDTPYFRRLVLPWVWGSFQKLGNTIYDQYKFRSSTPEADRGTGDTHIWGQTIARYVDLKVTNDATDGNFDNGGAPGVYQYVPAGGRMIWTYPANAPSLIIVGLSASVFIDWTATGGSWINMFAHWYVNGQLKREHKIEGIDAPTVGKRTAIGEFSDFFETEVVPGAVVELRFYMSTKDTGAGRANTDQYVTEFKVDYFKFALNSQMQLGNYNKFQNFKILDLLGGLTDSFDLQFNTDTKRKIVYVEPMHPYAVTNDLMNTAGGYIVFDNKDWSEKQDLSKDSDIELFNEFEREWIFKFKEDSSDGALKKMQDRYQSTVGQSKYILPARYKPGKKEVPNRFFSPLMHVEGQQFASVTGVVPQLPCIYPENISNTSSSESENTFEPKLAWYKGNIAGIGGWKFLNENNQVVSNNTLPYMFSVNYQPGGENDPILTYADQKIGNDAAGYVLGYGLLKHFFWQRLAIYRHGRKYKTYFKLNNSDVLDAMFRSMITLKGSQWVLTELKGYQPLKDDSTSALMWRWHPVKQRDLDNTFPSATSVENNALVANTLDFKYIKHLILYSDLPK